MARPPSDVSLYLVFMSWAVAHIDRMTGFVRYNMPQNAPGSLSLSQAYDVSAFVLSHARPHFAKNALVLTGALPAKYF